jgi:hypothetical protein
MVALNMAVVARACGAAAHRYAWLAKRSRWLKLDLHESINCLSVLVLVVDLARGGEMLARGCADEVSCYWCLYFVCYVSWEKADEAVPWQRSCRALRMN